MCQMSDLRVKHVAIDFLFLVGDTHRCCCCFPRLPSLPQNSVQIHSVSVYRAYVRNNMTVCHSVNRPETVACGARKAKYEFNMARL